MNRKLLAISSIALVQSAIASPAFDPANGHYYDVVTTPIDWTDAKTAAEGQSYLGAAGHLATIASQAEQNFVIGNLPGVTMGYILGGYESSGGEWNWVTGEPFNYTNWLPGEPSNTGGNEDVLQFHGFIGANASGFWNDIGHTYTAPGYVVEFEPSGLPESGTTSGLLALSSALMVGFRRVTRVRSTV